MISTRNLASLPPIGRLKSISQSLAILDAILQPEWEGRYFSFNARWGEDEALASMRDGAGDAYFLLFNSEGAILKGFAHESAMSPFAFEPPQIWPGIWEQIPKVFAPFFAEPAFEPEATTFCIWRTHADAKWQVGDLQFPEGDDPDGSAKLLALLDDNPQKYCDWATEYYEIEVDLAAVKHVFEHRPLTNQVVRVLNAELKLKGLEEDLQEIGYPI